MFTLQGLDELQSVQLLQCYLQEDYRGTRDSLKVFAPLEFHFLIYLFYYFRIFSERVSYCIVYFFQLHPTRM